MPVVCHLFVDVVHRPERRQIQHQRKVAHSRSEIEIRQLLDILRPNKEADEGKAPHDADHLIGAQRLAFGTGMKGGQPVSLLIHIRHRVYAQMAFRMRFHIGNLLLELLRIRPVVIPFADGDVFALCPQEIKGIVRGADAFLILVLRLQDAAGDIRILFFVLPDNLLGPIRRGIVVDQNLHGEIRLLTVDALQGLPDIFFMLIGGQRNADDRLFSLICFGHCFTVPPFMKNPMQCSDAAALP